MRPVAPFMLAAVFALSACVKSLEIQEWPLLCLNCVSVTLLLWRAFVNAQHNDRLEDANGWSNSDDKCPAPIPDAPVESTHTP